MFSTPETVAPIAGALNHRSSAPATGDCVLVAVVPVLALRMLMLTWSERDAPEVSNTVALSVCVPFANFVVSSRHCMPSAGEVSTLSGVGWGEDGARGMLPLAPM